MDKSKNMKIKNSNEMKKNIFKIAFVFFLLLMIVFPKIVSAQGIDCANAPSNTPGCEQPSFCDLGNNPKFQNLLGYATCIINYSIIPLIFSLAVVMFVWGVVQFVINSSEEAKKEKGRQFMLWGIIALAVMVSVWGLVSILSNTFNIDTSFIPHVRP